jgi:hypothetical protein
MFPLDLSRPYLAIFKNVLSVKGIFFFSGKMLPSPGSVHIKYEETFIKKIKSELL